MFGQTCFWTIRRIPTFGLFLFKKLPGKTLNIFCKSYFDHGDSNHIFGGGWSESRNPWINGENYPIRRTCA
jgi:hypothetical protein